MITKEEIATLFERAKESSKNTYPTLHQADGATFYCYSEISVMGVNAMNNAYFCIKYPMSKSWALFKMSNCVSGAVFWFQCRFTGNKKLKKRTLDSIKETDKLRSFIGFTHQEDIAL